MQYVDRKLIYFFFEHLNKQGIRYALIRNTGNELPGYLKDGKDIDLIVHHEDISLFKDFMKQEGFRQVIHPIGRLAGWTLAYGIHDFLFYKKTKSTVHFFIDVCQELCCHAIANGIWIPLDRKIQSDVWNYRQFDNTIGCWRLDEGTELIMYIVRAIFDKHGFNKEYRKSISENIHLIKELWVVERLRLIFFNYTDCLVELVSQGEFDKIIYDYYSFSDY